MIDDVRKKRGGDHGREEQAQRTVNSETPCGSENCGPNDVWDGRDGITMLEAV